MGARSGLRLGDGIGRKALPRDVGIVAAGDEHVAYPAGAALVSANTAVTARSRRHVLMMQTGCEHAVSGIMPRRNVCRKLRGRPGEVHSG